MKHGCSVLAVSLQLLGVAYAASFDDWQVQGPGRVTSHGAGSVSVSYESPAFESIVLRPPSPVVLPKGVRRIRAWYARCAGDFDLFFLVRDGAGAVHRVRTRTSRGTFPTIRRFKLREWSLWNQVESICLRPPAPIEERVQPESMPLARRSIWPDLLSLAEVEVQLARDRRDNEAFPERDVIRAGQGSLCLAGLSFRVGDGFEADHNWYLAGRARWGWDVPPRLFLDDLTRRSGPLRFALELRQGYQGPLVWSQAGEGELDRQKPMAVFDQRIELPLLPQGRYFLTTKTWLPTGALDAVRRMELQVAKGQPRQLKPLEPTSGWETGRPDHVFPHATTTAEVTLHVRRGAWPAGTLCSVRVSDWLGRTVTEQSFESRDLLRISCDGLREGTDYRAVAEWRRGKTVFDRAELHFGVASRPEDAPKLIPKGLPTRDELLMSRRATPIAEHWRSLMATRYEWEPITVERTREIDAWLDQVDSLGFRLISFNFGWGEVEPLPGVFRWREIERRVALAGQKGMHVFLTPTEWGHPLEFPRWVPLQPVLNQHGQVAVPWRSCRARRSVLDPVRRREHEHWLRAVVQRFLGNPTVVGYRTKPFIYLATNKPETTRADYAAPMQQGFSQWLRNKALAPVPIPKLFVLYQWSPARTGPDLSVGWREFTRFRTHCYVESVRRIMDTVRAVDPVRQVHIYRSSTPSACEPAIPLLKDGGEFHDEGGPFYFQRAMESMCLQAGVPYTNEGHQFTPPSKAMVDAGFFYGSCYVRGWSWLYRWHVHRHEDRRFAALPNVLRFIQAGMPALREWVSARGQEPEVLVFGSRAQKLLGEGRQGVYSNISGLELFAALFAYHQLPAHFADEYTDWVDLGRFKLVLAQGDVMTEHAMDRLTHYAKGGGKLVLVGDAGRFCVEQPKERHLLRQRLGGLPIVKHIAAPSLDPPSPGAAFRARKDVDSKKLEALLAWAGVKRQVRTDDQGFECVRKQSADGRRVYVAVFRRYSGAYDNIWYDEQVLKRWGGTPATVTVSELKPGRWHIEKLHRTPRDLGVAATQGRVLRFRTAAAEVAELQLFRLTPR